MHFKSLTGIWNVMISSPTVSCTTMIEESIACSLAFGAWHCHSQSLPHPTMRFMSKAPDPLCSQKVWRRITLVEFKGILVEFKGKLWGI